MSVTSNSMKAAIIRETGASSVLHLSDVPRPEPGPGQVLVRNRAVAVNYVDTVIRSGVMPFPLTFPNILGVEGAGEIAALGPGVSELAPGQRVAWFGAFGCGGYAEYVAVGAPYVVPIADSVSFEKAAAVPVNYATAHQLLFDLGRAQAGDFILVHAAAGGVGLALLQLAQPAGLRPIGLVGTAEKAAFIKGHGAAFTINYKTDDVEARVKEITGDAGLALSLNSVAGPTIMRDLGLLGPFGQVICYGMLAGLPEDSLGTMIGSAFMRSAGVRAADIYTYHTTDPKGFSGLLKVLLAKLAKAEIKPHIHQVLPLAEAGRAHQLLESGQTKGKLILSV